MTTGKPVIVVGGGWAGLSAAVELARCDLPVTLLESAKQLGGRARRVQFGATADNTPDGNGDEQPIKRKNRVYGIDNGQHLLIGAYDSTLAMMHTMGLREEQVLLRKDLLLHMQSPKDRTIKLKTGKLPAPLHLLVGLITAQGLSPADKIKAIKFCLALAKTNFTLEEDENCLTLFKRHRQSARLIHSLWEPLCLAALNTHINDASAIVFLRMLRETFSYSRTDSNLLFTATDLGKSFPDPALEYIEQNGGSVRLGQRVTGLLYEDGAIAGVTTPDETLASAHVILATPWHITSQLIAAQPALDPLAEQLNQFSSNPIVTVYLQYPEHVSMGVAMIGMVGTTSQWVMDRHICQQPGLISVIISGNGPHMALDNQALGDKVAEELAQQFPRWPEAEQTMVIREKRATFHCCSGINDIRPGNKTAIKGLWLAGDYTNTELPATLESAVRSGVRSARGIHEMYIHGQD